ncbi:hypothetical protein ACHAWO_012751 [Cyclotella atomus]|uniref:Phosphoglycerate mutase-like protein n=1 Tax=Cyclotella atomus TaxID=382360 RepID=A0ABD3NJR8_9STRA
MMLRRLSSRLPTVAKHIQARSQSSVAVSRSSPRQFQSTIQHFESQDFSSLALRRDDGDYYFEEHTDAIISALNSYKGKQSEVVVKSHVEPRVTAMARKMDLVEAAQAAKDYESYDKILILMRHGEAKHNEFQREYVQRQGKYVTDSSTVEESNMDEDHPVDPMLTGKGCGQMLALSRRTATFFNSETGLKPDLFVVSPLRRAIQSAIIAFPTHTPFTSLYNIPWVCNPYLMEKANGNKSEFVSSPEVLEEIFPGVDFNMMKSLVGNDVHAFNAEKPVPLFENKIDLLRRTDDFLRFLIERDERVIVVSSHATWLHSLLEFSLRHEQEENHEMFKKGQMLPVGIKFD